MMNTNYSKLLFLNGLVVFFLALICSSSIHADEFKVGSVNQYTAINNSLFGMDFKNLMQKEVEKRQNQLNVKKEAINKKFEEFKRDQDILSKKDLTKKQKELETSKLDIQRMQERFEMEISNKEQEENKKISGLFQKAVKLIGDEEKCDVILPFNVILHTSNKIIDLTNKVTAELDKIYKDQNKKK